MLNLQKRCGGEDENRKYLETRIIIRDRLLVQEMRELESTLEGQSVSRVHVPDPTKLHEMTLTVTPNEGYYRGGQFEFEISVPPEYNNVPPRVKCLTRVWHPNINEQGAVCLSLLRENSLDDFGWRPTRRLRDVVLGLSQLFTDLMDFDDPLNVEAAKQFSSNKRGFEEKVKEYLQKYARRR